MARKHVITARENREMFRDVIFKGGARTYEFDFRPWQEDNSTITSVTWTKKSGDVSISGETLSSGVATALLTFANAGGNSVEIKATSATEIFVTYLNVLARDEVIPVEDYGVFFGVC